MTANHRFTVSILFRRLAANLSLLAACAIGLSCTGCNKSDLGWEDLDSLEAEVARLPGNTISIPVPYANAPKSSFLRTPERNDPNYAGPPVTGEANFR